MEQKQIKQLGAAIDRSGNGIALMMLVSMILGLCGAYIAVDKIATEIHDAGRIVAHEIENKKCR